MKCVSHCWKRRWRAGKGKSVRGRYCWLGGLLLLLLFERCRSGRGSSESLLCANGVGEAVVASVGFVGPILVLARIFE